MSLKTRVNDQNFTSFSEYVPLDPDNAFFQEFAGLPPQQQVHWLPNLTVSDIYYKPQLEDWLVQSLWATVYNNTDGRVLKQNYLFGDQYVRITFRKIGWSNNTMGATADAIPLYRSVDHLSFSAPVNPMEITHDITDCVSNRTYQYVGPGTKRSFNAAGGFVVNLPKDPAAAK